MKFVVTDVKHPLASATKVAEAGNRMVLQDKDSYIENLRTGERIALRRADGVYKMDVVYDNGEVGMITLDSGAAVNVWPSDLQKHVKLLDGDGHRLRAANGTPIANYGNKVIGFRAKKAEGGSIVAGFNRQV